MELDILISTANEGINNIHRLFLEPMNGVKYIISHQIFNNKTYDVEFNRKDILYKKIFSRGLAKNRNKTLSMASADICLISDDDVLYKKKWLENIFKAFRENPESDIITFKVKTNEGEPKFKNYPTNPYWHNLRTVFQVSSIEIAFKLEKIQQTGLKFDEKFGIGELFNIGEENIFLMDALKKGLNIKFVPYYVVQHSFKKKFTPNTDRKIRTLGALFYRMFGLFCIFINLYSAIFYYNRYKKIGSIFKFIKLIFNGSFTLFLQNKRVKNS